MSTPTADPTLEPGKLVDADGNYMLQHKDIYALLKYVWTGVLLPIDKAKYKARVQLKENDFQPALQPGITALLEEYKIIQAHCTTFKDSTYPSIVALATDVYSYSQDVGGDKDTSYYANLLQACTDLDTEQKKSKPDPKKIADNQDLIKGIVDGQLESIEGLRTRANNATQSLRDFETQTKNDQQDLATVKGSIDSILTGPGGEIESLTKDISDKRTELVADLKEYEHDVIVACTTLTYAWVPFVGMVAAAIVAGVFGDKAVKMKKRIQEIEKLISDNDAKLATDKKVVAEVGLVDSDMKGVIDLIQPAITAIEKMIGVWDSIAGDLQAIKDIVEKKEAKGTAKLRELNQKIIIKKWNDLADAVDKYRKAAYITPEEKHDLPGYIDEWNAHIKT